jgi:alkaline phosphatase D
MFAAGCAESADESGASDASEITDAVDTDGQEPQGQSDATESSDAGDGIAQDGGGEGADPNPDYVYDGPLGPENLFHHGVASGDPTTSSVVLWTRITQAGVAPLPVYWELYGEPELSVRLRAGYIEASIDRDFTAKVDVEGLEPGKTMYYRFRSLGRESPVGRTRTLPDNTARFRAAVASCSNGPAGYFVGYRHLAARADLDLVIHLGDYIYEYGKGDGLRHFPPDNLCVSLDDYRTRYAAYREDLDLQEAHRQHPWVSVWDDHESANNAWLDGAPSHDPASMGEWSARKVAAMQAYFEWMPIREQADFRTWRSLQVGSLLNLLLLDTRLAGRQEQVPELDDPALFDPNRQLLGEEQEEWLEQELAASGATWTVLAQQVVFAPFYVSSKPLAEGPSTPLNVDQWDGYPAARERVLAMAEAYSVENLQVLSGDIHCSFANDVTLDPVNPDAYDPESGAGAVATEFVAPGITSSGFPGGTELVGFLFAANPHIQWGNVEQRGYLLMDWTPSRTTGEWYHADTVATPQGALAFAKAFAVEPPRQGLFEVEEPTLAPAAPPLAP